MGYRSNIAYVVAFHDNKFPEKAHADYLAFQEWVKHHSVPIHSVKGTTEGRAARYDFASVEQDVNHFKWHPEDGVLIVRIEDVKFYDGYSETQWHRELLKKCLDYETGAYRFIRIGEDYTDIEVEEQGDVQARGYSLYEWIDLHREIVISGPHEPIDKEES